MTRSWSSPTARRGLDAARAIGPKLAEQAVLVRANGSVRDLRLPLAGRRADPDPDDPRPGGPRRALRPPPLGRPPARRGGPPSVSGHEGRDRAADRERLLLRLRVPRAGGGGGARAAGGGDPARDRRGSRFGAARVEPRRGPRATSRSRASRTRSSSSTRPRATSRSTSRATSSTSAAARTSRTRADQGREAPLARRRLLARATRRSRSSRASTGRPSTTRRTSRPTCSGWRRRSGATTGGSAGLDLFHFSEHAPGMPFWHPRGMVIWNVLEDLRRRENLKRGYHEVRTPLLYDTELWRDLGPLGEVPRQHVPHPEIGERDFGLKPMNCPGHMLLFSLTLRSYRELPLRSRRPATCTETSSPGPSTGSCASGTSPRTTPTSSARRTRSRRSCSPASTSPTTSTTSSTLDCASSSPRGPRTSSGRTRSGNSPRRSSAKALARHGARVLESEGRASSTGRRSTCTWTDSLGRSWQMGTVQLDLQMPARFGLSYPGDDNAEHTPAVIHRALLGSLERFIGITWSTRRRAPRSGSRPSRCASSRSATRIARTPSRSRTACGPRASASTSTSGRRRWAGASATRSSQGALRRRLGRPRIARVRGRPATRRRAAVTSAEALADELRSAARL